MDYRKELLDILANEKLSVNNLKVLIKDRTQFTKKIKNIKTQLDELNGNLLEIEKKFDSRLDEINGYSNAVNNLYVEVFKDELMKTIEIIQDNLPNNIKSTIERDKKYPVIKLIEEMTGAEVGNIIININENNDYVANVKITNVKNNFQCEDNFILRKPKRVYKIIAYINTNLSYYE